MRSAFVTLLGLILLSFGAASSFAQEPATQPAADQTAGQRRVIAVTGTAEALFEPDQLVVRFSAVSGFQSPDAAPGVLDKLDAQIREALTAAEVRPSEIDSSQYLSNLAPGRLALRRSYTVRTQRLDASDRILKPLLPLVSRQLGMDGPAVQMPSIQYENRDAVRRRDQINDQLRREALINAREQAEQSAAALGCDVGAPTKILPIELVVVSARDLTSKTGYSAKASVEFELIPR